MSWIESAARMSSSRWTSAASVMKSFHTLSSCLSTHIFTSLSWVWLYYKKKDVLLCFGFKSWRAGFFASALQFFFLNLINLGNSFSFVQRPVRRPKMAYSVPSRSLWRRSCRRPGFGRVKTRVRSCVWGSRSRAVAGHAEDTVPYPENWTEPKKKRTPSWKERLRTRNGEEKREGEGDREVEL